MSAKRQPNMMRIMTDQQRGDALSIEGHPVLQTPNMDAIAGAGCFEGRDETDTGTAVQALLMEDNTEFCMISVYSERKGWRASVPASRHCKTPV